VLAKDAPLASQRIPQFFDPPVPNDARVPYYLVVSIEKPPSPHFFSTLGLPGACNVLLFFESRPQGAVCPMV
jgi:hypothetical protein